MRHIMYSGVLAKEIVWGRRVHAALASRGVRHQITRYSHCGLTPLVAEE